MRNEILKTTKVILTCENLFYGDDIATEVNNKMNKNNFKNFINARLTYWRKPQAYLQEKLDNMS